MLEAMARTTQLRFGTTVVVVALGVVPVVVALDFGQTRCTAAAVAESTTRPSQSARGGARGEEESSLSPRTIDKIIGKDIRVRDEMGHWGWMILRNLSLV